MNVIILVPVYNEARNLPTFFSFLYRLDPQPERYVFCENNSTDSTLSLCWNFKRKHEVIRVWLKDDCANDADSPNRYTPIAHIRQLLLTRARHLDPDYAIFLDADIFVLSRDMITRLTRYGKDIVGGAYLRTYSDGNLWLASKWATNVPDRYEVRTKPMVPRGYLDEPAMTSGGCLCLSRKIIQDRRINFYPLRGTASEDYGYCLFARDHGYAVYLDTSVHLKHLLRPKTRAWTRHKNKEYVPFVFSQPRIAKHLVKI